MDPAVLNAQYVAAHLLSDTDKFLEQEVTGSFRMWHIFFIIAATLSTIGVLLKRRKLNVVHYKPMHGFQLASKLE